MLLVSYIIIYFTSCVHEIFIPNSIKMFFTRIYYFFIKKKIKSHLSLSLSSSTSNRRAVHTDLYEYSQLYHPNLTK